MNLRVDLILPQEQRSASVLNLRFISRLASIVVPTVAALLIALSIINAVNLGNRVKLMERMWLETEPVKEKALQVLKQAKLNNQMYGELEGWGHSRVDWNTLIASLQRGVDPRIQLANLRVSQVLTLVKDGKLPARSFSLSLAGRASGQGAEVAVERLQQHLLESPEFAPLMESADIARYSADPDRKEDRLFQIDCTFKPSLFQ
jgi:hypothetical protein